MSGMISLFTDVIVQKLNYSYYHYNFSDMFRLISILILSTLIVRLMSSQDISVMTYNIRYDNPKDGDNWWKLRKMDVARLIDYYEADLVGIQEGLYHQVEFLDQQLLNYSFIGAGRDDGDRMGEFTAIFYDSTQFDVLESQTFWLSDKPDVVSVGWDASMERICTYGHFRRKVTSEDVHVFNTHFDHMGPQARLQSARLILRKIKKLELESSPLILMGDLNCLPESDPILTLMTTLDDASVLSKSQLYGPRGTFNRFDPDHFPERRIDYIFSKNMIVDSYRHIDDRRKNNLWVSDHLPVLAQLEIANE